AMSVAGLAVELLFKAVGWIPSDRHATITEAHISWNYTSMLNGLFLVIAGVLLWRAASTGGFKMVRMMNLSPRPTEGSADGQPRQAH
ncbi:MAG: hypothetical protein ACRD4P_17720, partial [Bryobacteraceae bacterium]